MFSSFAPREQEAFYHQRIKLLKARIDARYMYCASFWTDTRIIVATFLACVSPRSIPAAIRPTQVRAFGSLPAPAFEVMTNHAFGESD